MQRTSKTPEAARAALSKFLTTAEPCPHVLGAYVTRTAKSTATYRDGNARPVGHRGGRLVRSGSPCVFTPGHAGEHRTQDGRSWT